MIEFLPVSYVKDYVDENPYPLNELGAFVYTRTYSRWLDNVGRREFWHETVKRSIEYSLSLEYQHLNRIGLKPSLKRMRKEAKELFHNIYNTKQFPSGRSLWLGNGNERINNEFTSGNFNCSFTNIETWSDLGEVFYLLMVGTGCGLKSTKEMASKMPKVRTNVTLRHSDYKPVSPEQRLENTKVVNLDNGFIKIYIGDSKEGWVQAADRYFDILTKEEYEDIHTITISYNSIRPKGERLKTFGGTASGHTSLLDMFDGFDKVIKNQIDSSLDPIEVDEKGYGQVRPIHILDMANLIGANVVIGGKQSNASK